VRAPTFRVKPYAHPKYKFVVRAKLGGKWKRSYFTSEAEAVTYADNQNASLESRLKGQRSERVRSDGDTNSTCNWYELEKFNRKSTGSSHAVSRKAIVVLGMHRSGTSALCGALNVLGVNFGERLAPATKDNEKGHWEHHEIVSLHDELLRSLGSRWDDDRPLPSDWVERDVTRDIRSLLIGILERDFAHASLFGLKDPRMSRLMPLWLPIFQTLRIEPHFVLIVRHPWEVAESLAKRDGLEHAKSYLLWLEHVAYAISATGAHQRSVVCYEEMMNDPIKVLTELRNELGVNLRAPIRVRASLRKFLEPSLRHHNFKKGKTNERKSPIPKLVLDLYETIRNASAPVEIGEKTAPILAQFYRGSELFYPRVNLVETELACLDKEIAKNEKTGAGREGLVRLQVFHPVAEGYRETESQTRYFASGSWKLLIIDLPGGERNLDQPFRIDPVTYPAVIDIAEIALKRPSTGEILWAATGSTGFAPLTVDGTACRLAHDSYLRILSFGNDPQLWLPQSTIALGDSPLRLELSILVDASPQAISTCLTEIQHHVAEEKLTDIRILTERLAEHQTKLEASRRKIAALETRAGRLAQELSSVQAAWTGVLRPSYIAALRGVASSLSQARKRSPSRWKRIIQAAQGHDERRILARTLKMAEERVKKIKHDLRSSRTFSLDAARLIREAAGLQSSTIGQLLQTGPGEAEALQAQSPVADMNESTLKALFDPDWYTRQNPAVSKSGMSPLEHFIKVGAGEMRDPHPLFDVKWYLKVNPDVAASGLNPLAHFVNRGAAEGRDPHPLFDTSWYVARYMGKENRTNPLVHFLREGAEQGLNPHPLFHTRYYAGQKTANISHAAKSSLALKNGSAPNRANRRAKSTVYAFTSICFNYVPKAAVLARTLKQHNPDVRFCLLINDWIPEKSLDGRPEFDEVITIGDLDIPNKAGWVFGQSAVELCTAVKGYFLSQLLEREDCACAFYFDPDIVIFSDLNLLIDELKDKSILLTPHLTHPESSLEAVRDNEICALKHGVYNLGFLGVRPSPEGLRFAQWWSDRLEKFCRADIPGGLFTDQRWIDLAPAFFTETHVIRHPGCNVATWNMSNRRIEGSFEDGFTVNGQPLIFYHYSGFDSGAQVGMLNKYGSGMPAAHLLREWYISETCRGDLASFADEPWAFGFFSNGEPISNEQRSLYRDREDLQKAFPNPFDASTRGNSYYHWYQSEVAKRPASDGNGLLNPLVEYLETKPLLRPNPVFDPGWYLSANPGVAASGMNPLLHYVNYGAFEGRRPARDFDAKFYVSQLPAEERSTNPLVHYLEKGQRAGHRINPLYSEDHDAGQVKVLLRWATISQPIILLINHFGGGGTEKHVTDLVGECRARARFLHLTPLGDKSVILSTRGENLHIRLRFDPIQQFDDLLRILIACRPARIHIHHLLGNEHYARRLVSNLRLPFDFTTHDYYLLAPHPHLVGPDKEFVGEDLSSHASKLLAASIAPGRPQSLEEWHAAHRWILTDADRVICPSHDVAARFQRHYPHLNPILAPHPEKRIKSLRREIQPLGPTSKLRIAVIGDFLKHKGSDTVLTCAEIARAESDPLVFELIGDPRIEIERAKTAGMKWTGRYIESELDRLIADRQPHLLWYPSRCPETYCYTLSAGLNTGLPVVVADIGAFPERVADRAWSWVCPWDWDPLEWIAFFLDVRARHFLPMSPPVPPSSTASKLNHTFYPDDYLAPVERDSGIARPPNKTLIHARPAQSPADVGCKV
jgi:glycosyltransferase involved in cell wall biosynthesis